MEKLKNNNKKISLILLIIMIFNIMTPQCSNAVGAITSILTKPLQSLCMIILDHVNGFLTGMFVVDEKATGFVREGKDQWVEFQNTLDQEGFLTAIWEGLDNAETAVYDLLISPDDIFSGKVQIANANLFSSKFVNDNKLQASDLNVFNHLMEELRETAAGLYYIMRNLAVVILLCLLIYCGIRIVLASNVAGEKAQWKMYLLDWLKALALVMFIHVIIIGIFYIADIVTDGINQSVNSSSTIVTAIRKDFNVSLNPVGSWIYVIMYGYITYMTIVFLVAYFKRLLFIIILIVIAPIMGALYSMGKTTKANFNRWFKELTFGIFVQPFHLLIYSILFAIPLKTLDANSLYLKGVKVASYGTLDVQLYALIAIAMIRPIEKYMRKIFGMGETLLDNVASFESGKKTIDTGVKVVKQVVDTAVKIGAAVATGGASAAAGGAASAAGGAASTAAPALAGGESALAGGTSGMLGGMSGDMLGGMSGDMLGGMPGDMLGGMNDLSPELIQEGNLLDSEDQALWDLTPDVNNMGDWTEADEQALNELYDEQIQRRDNYDARKEEYLANGSGETNQQIGEVNQIGGTNEIDESAQTGGNNQIEESKGNGQDAMLNAANVQILAGAVDVNAGSPNINTADAQLSSNEINPQQLGANIDGEQSDNQKPDVSGSALGQTLRERLRGARESIEENPIYQVLSSAETQEGMLDISSAMHEFADSFYTDGGSKDWQANVEYAKKGIEKKKEESFVKFLNDPKNTNKAIDEFELKDKTDKNGNKVTAQEQAKEKLEKMKPYVAAGITDMGKLASLVKLQETGLSPKQAMQSYVKINKEATKVENFVKNENNIQSMRNIVADRMNIPQERRSDPTVIQQINQQVKQDIREGSKYISSGAAKDPETLSRLVQLERKIDQQVNLKGTSSVSKAQYVVKADKLIDKAIKDGIKNIKLPKVDGSAGAKELQKILNNELKERRGSTDNSGGAANSSRSSSDNSNSTNNSKPNSKPIGDGDKK